MKVLVDTNVLLRIAQLTSPDRPSARSALVVLTNVDAELCVVPQVIYEFWVVATRPLSANGLGMDLSMAENSIVGILDDYLLLKDERGVFGHWQSLVVTNAVLGKPAHDARLVAAMNRHRIPNILTFNTADFARYPSIRVFTPADIIAGRLPP